VWAEIDSTDAALSDLDICLKPAANDTGLWMCKGNICYDARRYNSAIDAYNVILLIDSTNKSALINRADALVAAGQYEQAIQDYNTLSRKDKYNPLYYFNIGFCYLQLLENEKAILSFGKALDTEYEPLGMLLTFRAVAYHNLKLQAEACSDWQKAILAGYEEAKKYQLNYCK
jgi:tetratricopeptide (TPR) repeat protein